MDVVMALAYGFGLGFAVAWCIRLRDLEDERRARRAVERRAARDRVIVLPDRRRFHSCEFVDDEDDGVS